MSCPGTSLGLGHHPSPTSSRHSCRFLYVPPYALGEGWHRSLLQAPGWRWMGVWWEGNAWHTPVSRPPAGSTSVLPRDGEAVLGPASFPVPRPGPTRGPEPGRGGGAGRLPAHPCNVLYFGRASAGPAGWPHYAPGAPRSALRLHGPLPQLCAGREPAPLAPSPRGAGRGCGAGSTSDSALRARRLHGAQCQRAEPAARAARRGLPSRRGDAARA